MSGKGPNYLHNLEVFNQLRPGDRVQFQRRIYSHWGIYFGNGKIIHLAGEDNDGINGKVKPEHLFTICGRTFDKARVSIDDFWDVVGQDKAYLNNSKDKLWSPLDVDSILNNALQKIGEVKYSLIYSNCEHFVNWCRYGNNKSDQVDSVITGLAAGGTVAFAAGVIYAIAKAFTKGNKEEEEKQEQSFM
ncbi:unnamed protein product [Lymnaea stagnalis]|uniref:LRAT domain-containing protein n=1 Tax=Lymnaea stagnalis TaxID=6523 RepID=A0AAV2HRL8_LYMST